MIRQTQYALLLALSAALPACSEDIRLAEIYPPGVSTSVKVVKGTAGADTQLSFSLQRSRNDDSWTSGAEEELKAVGFEACGADRGWGKVRSNSQEGDPNEERRVRFYAKNKSTFLAMIPITQMCDGRNLLCQQNVVVRQTQFPAEVGNRAELVHAICAGTAPPPGL